MDLAEHSWELALSEMDKSFISARHLQQRCMHEAIPGGYCNMHLVMFGQESSLT